MPISAQVAHHRARIANAALRKDNTAANEARRDLRATRLAEWISDALASAPPLTDDQRRDLANLLRPGVTR